MDLQLSIHVLLLVEEAPAPGFNTRNLLLCHELVFAAESVQDSPPPHGWCGGRGSGRSQLLDILGVSFGCGQVKFADTSSPFGDPSCKM